MSWLISLGREAFEKVADCPDRVMELPEVLRLFELSRNFSHEGTTWSRDGKFRVRRVTKVWRELCPSADYPEFESFAYVTFEPYKQVTGLDADSLGDAVRARGIESKFPFLTFHVEPDGEQWDFGDKAEFIRRLPQLARHSVLLQKPWQDEADHASLSNERVVVGQHGPYLPAFRGLNN